MTLNVAKSIIFAFITLAFCTFTNGQNDSSYKLACGATPVPCNINQDPLCPPSEGHLEQSECLPEDDEDQTSTLVCKCNSTTHVEHCLATPNRKCVEILHSVGSTCEIDEQCQVGTSDGGISLGICHLTLKVCICDVNAAVVSDDGQKCLPKRTSINEPCQSHNQCLGVGFTEDASLTQCSNNQCACNANNAIASSGKCLKIATTVGEQCTAHSQCTQRLGDLAAIRCEGGFCSCVSSVAFNSTFGGVNKCYRFVDATCTENQQCSHMGDAQCVLVGGMNKCTCINSGEGFPGLISEDRQRCLNYVQRLGEACERKEQCRRVGVPDVHTDCWNAWGGPVKYCECISDNAVEAPDRSRCLVKFTDGSSQCEVNEQCDKIPNSECKIEGSSPIRQCRCEATYVSPNPAGQFPDHQCRPIAYSPLTPCDDVTQCTAGMGINAVCSNRLCQCGLGTVYLPFDRQCHIPIGLGSTCQSNGQCMVSQIHSVCNSGRCACKLGAVLSNGVCYEQKRVGDSCSLQIECEIHLGNTSHCASTNRCQCRAGSSAQFENTKCIAGSNDLRASGALSFLAVMLLLVFGEKL